MADEKEPEGSAEEKPAEEQEAPEAATEEESVEDGESGPKVPAGYVPVRALQDERLKRQELEKRLAERPQPVQPAEPQARPYTDDELDALEDDARARGDRSTIRAVQNYRIDQRARALLGEFEKKAQRSQIANDVTGSLMQTFPALKDMDSDLFRASAREFNVLASEYAAKGADIASDPHATEIAVGRALRKDPTLQRKHLGGDMPKKKQAEAADTHVETGEAAPAKKAASGPKLSERELAFAKRSGMDPKEYAKWKVSRSSRG